MTEKKNVGEVIKRLYTYPKLFSITNFKLMNEQEIELGRRFESFIPVVKPILKTGKTLSLNTTLSESYSYLSLLGEQYPFVAKEKEKDKPFITIYPANDGSINYFTQIGLRFSESNGITKTLTPELAAFKIPDKLDEFSPLMLAHEHIHALKDTYKAEYEDSYVYGEVIPMFLELLMSDKIKANCRCSLIKNRLFNIKNNYALDKKNEAKIFSDRKNLHVYPYFITDMMRYPHSFYYSLQLYDLYLEDKDLVLSEIGKVLCGTKTTRDILQDFGVIHSFDEEMVKKGIVRLEKKIS